jgi:hypothetical protein
MARVGSIAQALKCIGDLEIQLRLADGFIPGVEQRRGLSAVPRAGAFLFAGSGVFDVEHSAALATVENVTAFYGFRLFVRSL